MSCTAGTWIEESKPSEMEKTPQGFLWDLSLCMVSDEEEEGVGCKR